MFCVKHYKEDLSQGGTLTQNDTVEEYMSFGSAVEPSCCFANNLSFVDICCRMEILWKVRVGELPGRSLQAKTDCLLLNGFLNIVKEESENLFPLLRLYCPDKDNHRNYGVNETVIGQAYCNVLGLEKWGGLANLNEWSGQAKMILNFRDTEVVPSDLFGDLSLVVEHVMSQQTKYTPSQLTVGDMNRLLHEFSGFNPQRGRRTYKSRENKEDKENVRPNANTSLAKVREEWFRKVIHEKKLSPLEHKWLVRIIMKNTDLGIRSTSILRAYSPYANGLLAADGNLKRMCDKLAGPYFL